MPRKGQFKKGGGRVGAPKRRRTTSTSRALTIVEKPQVKVIRVPQSVVSRQAPRSATRRRSTRSLVLREHGAGELIPGPFRQKSAAVSSALGYADGGKGLTGLKELIDKVPTTGKVPRKLVLGLVANYFADRGDWIDAAAQSLIDIGAYEFGQAGFSMSGEDDEGDF